MSGETAEHAQLEEYKGNCHCGELQFSCKSQPLKKVSICNCSICTRKGYLLLGHLPNDNVVIRKGEGTLKKYEFGNKTVTHVFCPKCGTAVMILHPKDETIEIKVRSLTNIDLAALEIGNFNGAELDPPYQPPRPSHEPQDAEDGLKIYDGNCHCGSISYTVKSKPINDIGVLSCNCSLCSRNGDLWIYPKKADVDVQGWDKLTDYAFLNETSLHSFCGTCGVSVLVKVLGKEKGDEICPINVRTISGVDLDQLRLKKYDGARDDPQYVVPV